MLHEPRRISLRRKPDTEGKNNTHASPERKSYQRDWKKEKESRKKERGEKQIRKKERKKRDGRKEESFPVHICSQ